MVGVFEVLGAALVLWNRFTVLGLAVLAPIIVNIVAYLLVLQNGIGFPPVAMACFLLIAGGFLAWNRRERWLPLFR